MSGDTEKMGEKLTPKDNKEAEKLYSLHRESTKQTLEDLGKLSTRRKRLKLLNKFEKGQKVNDQTIKKSEAHFREHEKEYKEQAVAEASAKGVEINYPPYTTQIEGAELSTPEDIEAEQLRKDVADARLELAANTRNMEDIAKTREEFGVKPDIKVVTEHLKVGNKASAQVRKTHEKAKTHYIDNEEKYKLQAINEARAAGVDINYPPYTDQQPKEPGTPTQPQ